MQLGLPIYCTKDGFFPIEPNETDPIESKEVHPDRLYPMELILTVVETNNSCYVVYVDYNLEYSHTRMLKTCICTLVHANVS